MAATGNEYTHLHTHIHRHTQTHTYTESFATLFSYFSPRIEHHLTLSWIFLSSHLLGVSLMRTDCLGHHSIPNILDSNWHIADALKMWTNTSGRSTGLVRGDENELGLDERRERGQGSPRWTDGHTTGKGKEKSVNSVCAKE